MDQAIEKAKINIEWMNNNYEKVVQWFKTANRGKKTYFDGND